MRFLHERRYIGVESSWVLRGLRLCLIDMAELVGLLVVRTHLGQVPLQRVCCASVIWMVLLIYYIADFLMVVPVSGLTLLIAHHCHAVDRGDATAVVEHRFCGRPVVLHLVELILGVQSVQVLKVARVESILKALLERADNVEVLLNVQIV